MCIKHSYLYKNEEYTDFVEVYIFYEFLKVEYNVPKGKR